MDFIAELSDDCDVEKIVLEKVHYQKLMVDNLNSLEIAIICLQLSEEYLQQDIANIVGLAQTTVWSVSKGAYDKLSKKISKDVQ